MKVLKEKISIFNYNNRSLSRGEKIRLDSQFTTEISKIQVHSTKLGKKAHQSMLYLINTSNTHTVHNY